MRAPIAIFPGVACRYTQNSTIAMAGITQLIRKSAGPWIIAFDVQYRHP